MNNKKNKFLCRLRNFIPDLCITILCFIMAFKIIDCVFLRDIISLPSYQSCINFINPLFISITSVLVTVMVLFYQVYFNRYTGKELVEHIINEFIVLSFIAIIQLVSFIVFWFSEDQNSIEHRVLVIFFIYYVIRFVVFIIRYKTYSVSFFIRKIYKKKIHIIEKGKMTIDEFDEILIQLSDYLEEAVAKNELLYISNVVDTKELFFNSFITNFIRNFDSNQNNELIQTEKKLCNSLLNDYKKILNLENAASLRDKYTNFIKKYNEKCISYNRKEFIEEEQEQLFYSIYRDNNLCKDDRSLIFNILFHLLDQIANKEKEEYVNCWINNFSSLFYTSEKFSENLNYQDELFHVLFRALEIFTKKDLFDSYKKLFKNGIEAISLSINEWSKSDIKNFIIFYSRHLRLISDYNADYKNEFISCLQELLQRALSGKSKDLIVSLGAIYSDILINDSERKISEKIYNDYKNDLIICFRKFPDCSFIFFDYYENDIKNKKLDIKSILTLYEEITYIAIKTECISFLGYSLSLLNDYCKAIYTQKDNIFEVIDFYSTILCISSLSGKRKSYYVVYDFFDDLINDLFKEKLNEENAYIEKVITVFDKLAGTITDEIDKEIKYSFFDSFKDIEEKIGNLNSVETMQIAQIVFDIGVTALENNDEILLRRVSNKLGWLAKNAIDKNNDAIRFKDIISKSVEIYNIASDLGYSEKLLSFLGTLYILLGSHVYNIEKEEEKKDLTDFIIKKIQELNGEYKHILEISKNIRALQGDSYNGFFEVEDAKKLIEDFYLYVFPKN